MPPDDEIVYLVDGSSYLHRAYHAIRSLSNSKGFPTNAVFGFTKMFLKLMSEKQPSFLAVLFDAKGPTFRHQIYEPYKANRPPMPENLVVQIPVIRAIVESLGVVLLEKEGYEADDLMGTLARVCAHEGFKVILVSGDKDFRQLVSPQVALWDPMKDRYTDYESLKRKYGLEPFQFVDVMGLAGDNADNIPGVPGIGEKTALELVKEFSTLENVLDHSPEIPKKRVRENLLKYREQALLSKKLVSIKQDAPIPIGPEQLRAKEVDNEELSKIFREMEFRGLWDQFTPKGKERVDYGACTTKAALLDLVRDLSTSDSIALRVQSSGERPSEFEMTGIGLCWGKGEAVHVSISGADGAQPGKLTWDDAGKVLKGLLENKAVRKVGHDMKHDAKVLRVYGIRMEGIHFDTMVASYLINPGLQNHDLATLARHYLNRKMGDEAVSPGKRPTRIHEDSCERVDLSWRLKDHLEGMLRREQNETLFYELEMNLIPVLVEMELVGIKLDTEFLEAMGERIGRRMKDIETEIYQEAGMEFNIHSSQQLGHVLFEKLQLPTRKRTTKTKKYSTDVSVLQGLAAYPHKVPGLVLKYRTLSKIKSTYLDGLLRLVDPATKRVHTTYNQTVTATGRLSSSNPNLQNIPIRGEEGRDIRRAFVAEEGHVLVSADYSQVELRILAHYSRDPAFLEAFRAGQDIHARTASELLGVPLDRVGPELRRLAKVINFGIIYGMGPQRLSQELQMDRREAKEYIRAYYERYKGVAEFREKMIQNAKRLGYVTTLFKRRRYLPGIQSERGFIRAEAERMAINTPIQGTAADLIKKAMIHIHRRFRKESFRSKMLLQVHDELVFEVPEPEIERAAVMIRQEMENVYPLRVPLRVDLHKGKNWDEAH